MNPYKPLIILSILTITFFPACSEKDESPVLEGDIIGYAFCFDEYGNRLEDFSGIQVVTEPDRKYSAVTDKHGFYELKNVTNGTYNLSFEKEGFGTMKMFFIQHSGGLPTIVTYYDNDDVAPFLYKNITTQITHIEFQDDSIIAGLKFSGEYIPERIDMVMYFSYYENFTLFAPDVILNFVLSAKGINYASDYGEGWQGLLFAHGETMYCKAAVYSFRGEIQVNNFLTIAGISSYMLGNTIVFPNLSSELYEFSFTIP